MRPRRKSTLAYTPNLTVTLKDEVGEGPDVLYEVRNDGHKDLDSVIVERPETPDRVRYPVATRWPIWEWTMATRLSWDHCGSALPVASCFALALLPRRRSSGYGSCVAPAPTVGR